MSDEASAVPEKRKPGRPRTRPLPDPNAPKRRPGRPRKDPNAVVYPRDTNPYVRYINSAVLKDFFLLPAKQQQAVRSLMFVQDGDS